MNDTLTPVYAVTCCSFCNALISYQYHKLSKCIMLLDDLTGKI